MIWFRSYSLEELGSLSVGNMVEHLGIVFTGIGDDWIEATMPVDSRTRQPEGILHGGASVVLAETLGSVAANLTVDPAALTCVGLEVNANHLRPVREGHVRGTARPLHLGRRTQVWEIQIRNGEDKLVCASRLTVAVVERTDEGALSG